MARVGPWDFFLQNGAPMILRYTPYSPFSRKVRIAAGILGLAHEIKLEDADPTNEHVHYEPIWSAVPELVARLARAAGPTVLVTMGAGDVTEIGPRVLGLLEAEDSGGQADDSAL